MAKKPKQGSKYELDEYGFSTELDIPNFGFDSPEVKDDRKPMTRAAKGFAKGVKETVTSPAFVRRVMKQALPKGYGSAMDLGDEAVGSLRNLYNNAAREIRPALNELKRTTNRVMPKASQYLPKKVADRLKKWSESDDKSAAYSAEAAREAQLMMQLGDIFHYQAETQARQEAEGFVRDKLKEGIEHTRHRDQIGQLNAIRQAVAQQSAYRLNVESKFQRKSLELQFRQFFLARDMFEEQRRMNAITEANLAMITKNTGLPDFAKLQKSEAMHEFMRNRFLSALTDGLFERRRNFVRNLGVKVGDIAREKIGGFVGGVRSGLEQANMMMDMSDGMPIDAAQMGGNLAGGFATNAAGGALAKRLGGWIAKNRKVVRFGNRLQQGVENLPQMAGQWARSDNNRKPMRVGERQFGGILDWLINFGKDTVSQALGSTSNKMDMDGPDNLNKPAPYSRHAQKSITEIIPGFLARIYQELQILRTGDNKTGLTTYDFTTNKFVSKSVASKNAFDSVISKFGKDATGQQVAMFIDQVDPEKKLSAAQRKDLAMQLLRSNMANAQGNKTNFTGGSQIFKGKNAQTYKDLFAKHLQGDTSGQKELNLSRNFNQLGVGMSDVRARIQEQINLGNTDWLIEAGLLNPQTGELDMNKLYAYNLGLEFNPDGKRGKIPGFAEGGMHRGGAAMVGERGAELRVDGPARYYSAEETTKMLKESGISSSNEQLIQESRTMVQYLASIDAKMEAGMMSFGINLGGAGKRLMGLAGKTLGRAGRLGNRMVDEALKSFGRAGKALGWLGGKALEKWQGIKDVYIEGDLMPRLTAWKLKAGEYRDVATGRVIQSYKDISGAVMDKAGNIVMTAEEARRAFMKDGLGKKALTGFFSLAKKAGEFGNNLISGVPGVLRAASSLARTAWNQTMHRAQDIYIKGQEHYPVLLARVMEAGGYVSERTGKVIRSLKDIDGPVRDLKGNVVLTMEQMRMGLVDRWGRPVTAGLQKLMGMLRSGAATGLSLLTSGARALGGLAGGAFAKGKNLLGGLFKGMGLQIGGGKSIYEQLVAVRMILDQRLPGGKKRNWSDVDGDGDRDGSWQDLMQQQKDKLGSKLGSMTGLGSSSEPKGVLQALKEMLRSLRKIETSSEATAENTEEGLLDQAADLGNVADGLGGNGRRRGGRSAGKGGRLRRFARGAWTVGKGVMASGAGKLLGAAGTAYAAYSAYDNLKQGNYGSAAVDAGLGVAGAAATAGGVGALGTGLMAAGGTALGVAGAVLASPVVLGALALGAVGGLAYLGYRHATRKTLGAVSKVRYAQYGFDPQNADAVQMVFGLEDRLEPALVWEAGRPKGFDAKKVQLKELVESFGVDPNNPLQSRRWLEWFAHRFKPVYFTHLTALKAVAESKKLADVDSLKGAEKKRYLELSRFAEGPYNVTTSPLGDGKQLPMDAPAVERVAREAAEAAAKDTTESQSKTGLTASATMGAQAATEGKPATAAGATLKAGASASATAASAAGGAVLGAAGMTSVTGTFSGFGRPNAGRIDALSVIRFKTYGLHEMVLEKTRALDMLEAEVAKNLALDGKGPARWKGSVEKLVQVMGPGFGVNGAANDTAYDWMSWFNLRFLPVFLNFATAVRSATGKGDLQAALQALKPQDQPDVAAAIYSTPGVWGVVKSPWPGFVLNTEVRSIEANFQALKEGAKKTVLDEKVGSKQSRGTGADNGTGVTDGTNGAGKSVMARAWESVSSAASGVWQKVKQTVSDVGSGIGEAAYTAMHGRGPSMLSGGRALQDAGEAGSGAMADLPMPSGEGRFGFFRELFEKVGKLVGVDPKVLATISAIESGFRPAVKAATSTATGLFQFIKGTWDTMMRKYGTKFGIPAGTPPTDPRANALLGAAYIKENFQALKSVKGTVTDTDVYMAHFLGAGGAKKFFQQDPSAIAATVMPKEASANRPIFYTPDGRPRTIAEVYEVMNQKVQKKGQQYGLDSGGGALQSTAGGTSTAGGGRGSVNPGVAIPVSDQVPAPQAGVGPAPNTAAMGNAGSSGINVPIDPAAAAAGSGLNPAQAMRSASLGAQQQVQRDELARLLGSVDSSGRESVRIQSDMLTALQSIERLLSGKFAASGASQDQQSQAAAATRRTPGQMPTPPVSMAKAAI